MSFQRWLSQLAVEAWPLLPPLTGRLVLPLLRLLRVAGRHCPAHGPGGKSWLELPCLLTGWVRPCKPPEYYEHGETSFTSFLQKRLRTFKHRLGVFCSSSCVFMQILLLYKSHRFLNSSPLMSFLLLLRHHILFILSYHLMHILPRLSSSLLMY